MRERQGTESFQDFYARIGKAESRKMIEDLMNVPPYEKDPSFYSDWGDPREFTMGDIGMGECAVRHTELPCRGEHRIKILAQFGQIKAIQMTVGVYYR